MGVARARSPRRRSPSRRSQFVQAHADGGRLRRAGRHGPTRCSRRGRCSGCARPRSDAPGSLAYLQSQEGDAALDDRRVRSSRSPSSRSARRRPRCSTGCAPRAAERADRRGVNSTCWAVLALGRSTRGDDALAARAPGANGRLVVGGRRPARLERHGRRARGASRRRRPRRAGHASGALPALVPEPRRRLRADARPRLRRAVDRLGDPGPRRGGRTPPRTAFAYLARLKRADGSYRYSTRYVTTPVWVTSQVLAALAKKPFPFD